MSVGQGVSTSMKIAEPPRISERTVNCHIRNAKAGPNAGNKTDAVLRAALPGCYRSRWTPIFLPPCVLRHRLFGELIPQDEDALPGTALAPPPLIRFMVCKRNLCGPKMARHPKGIVL